MCSAGFAACFVRGCEGLALLIMGAKQTKEDETPTSPKSPRVSPVDHASQTGIETSVPAQLDRRHRQGRQRGRYRNFGYTMYNLILLGFVGDFDADNFDKVVLRVLLVFYIIVVIVIFLNVLIAIVSDSYEMAMAQAEALYYRSRL